VSVEPEDDQHPSQEDEIPRQGLLANMPKRSLSRVILLLAALGGIVYLRQRTSSIAGCMADAFRIAPAAETSRTSPTIRARVVVPAAVPESPR